MHHALQWNQRVRVFVRELFTPTLQRIANPQHCSDAKCFTVNITNVKGFLEGLRCCHAHRNTSMHAYIYTYMRACMHRYIHSSTYMSASRPTCLQGVWEPGLGEVGGVTLRSSSPDGPPVNINIVLLDRRRHWASRAQKCCTTDSRNRRGTERQGAGMGWGVGGWRGKRVEGVGGM